MCLVLVKTKRGSLFTQKQSNRQLWSVTWMLRIEPGSSRRRAKALTQSLLSSLNGPFPIWMHNRFSSWQTICCPMTNSFFTFRVTSLDRSSGNFSPSHVPLTTFSGAVFRKWDEDRMKKANLSKTSQSRSSPARALGQCWCSKSWSRSYSLA